MNQVILTGRIATDLELKTVKNGTSMVRFNMAVPQGYSVDGEKVTDFYPIIAFRRAAENLVQYKTKGDYIELRGRLNRHDYYDENNKHRVMISVQADWINYPNVGERRNKKTNVEDTSAYDDLPPIDIDEDDLPF